MKIPKKITPDPIIDSVIELRFQPAINKEEVFVTLFKEFSKEFSKFKLSNIPLELRKEKDFVYAVEGTLSSADYSLGIGSNVISFNCVNGYKGWNNYSSIIKRSITRIFELGVVSSYERVGVRYINFFKEVENIAQHLHFHIDFGNKNEYSTNQTVFVTKITNERCAHTLNITDKVSLKGAFGSLIDIDTAQQDLKKGISSDELLEVINICRVEEKKLFFSLIKPEFLKNFNPEY